MQAIDFYGNATSYIIQTVRTDESVTAFVTQVSAQGSVRIPARNLCVKSHRKRPRAKEEAKRTVRNGKREYVRTSRRDAT